VDGVAYGAFIVPGLVMLSLLTQSIANARAVQRSV
jgi:ABC-2 type transport system permease protein